MSSADRAVVVLTTTGNAEEARTMARALVGERLAACVNLLPEMTSIYRWQGAVQEDHEHQLVIKTTRQNVDAVQARIRELHSYELPEFLVLSVDGSAEYLRWLEGNTSVTD